MPSALRKRLEQRDEQRRLSRKSREDAEGSDAEIIPQKPRIQVIESPRLKVVGRSSSVHSSPSASLASRPKNVGRAASVGAAGKEGGRQMFDKNELRAAHKDLFVDAIRTYQDEMAMAIHGLENPPDLSTCTLRPNPRFVQVYVRKRPLFNDEVSKRSDFDVVGVVPGKPLSTQVMLHSCLFQADLRTPVIHHSCFRLDGVFHEQTTDREVYRVSAFNLVMAAKNGGASTLLMFGQTGSGKTHTMTAIERMASNDLLDGSSSASICIEFIELKAGRCFDLLARGTPELRLRETSEGAFSPEGATELFPKSAEQLHALMQEAHARRATSATAANSESSRSHAVCILKLLDSEGTLILADCAGTERRKDSAHHNREQMQEGAEINASLHALKECVRHLASKQRIPPHAYRASCLTKVLAKTFSRTENSTLAVICTVSPAASDTEHSLTTLRTGAALRGSTCEEKRQILGCLEQPRRELHPRQWTPEQLRVWLAGLEGGGFFEDVIAALPTDFTGQMLVRLSAARCVQLCGGDSRRGQLLFERLHQAIRNCGDVRVADRAAPIGNKQACREQFFLAQFGDSASMVGEEGEVCAICLQELKGARSQETNGSHAAWQVLSCGHVLHEACILHMRRFGSSAKCPLCRAECLDLCCAQDLLDAAAICEARGELKEKADLLNELLQVEPRHVVALCNLASMYQNGSGVKQNLGKAMELYEKAQLAGSAGAACNLGIMYNEGQGTQVDVHRARQLFEQAAAGGSVQATYNLGLMHSLGRGSARDLHKTQELYEIAHLAGNRQATYGLAMLYITGDGGVQDLGKARELFELASIDGNVNAAYRLGLMYAEGQGGDQDLPAAFTILQQAHVAGHISATYDLGLLYAEGRGVERNLLFAFKLFEQAHLGGEVRATRSMAVMYQEGTSVRQDLAYAKYLFEQAHSAGDAGATRSLALIYLMGLGVQKDISKAFKLFEEAHLAGNRKATASLATMYAEGQGVTQDLRKAKALYEEAYLAGHAGAARNLGLMYYSGIGIKRNLEKAFDFFVWADAAGDTHASFNLGVMYAEGQGVEQNLSIAVELYEKARRAGEVQASYFLADLYSAGHGVKQDFSMARHLYTEAHFAGVIKATYKLAGLYAEGRGVHQDLSAARELYSKAHLAGYPQASYDLALLYIDGHGVKPNLTKGKELLEQARASGSAAAARMLSILCAEGNGVQQDFATTMDLHEEADAVKPKDGNALIAGVCANCGEPDACKLCGGCLTVMYCRQTCQREHWRLHRKSCKAIARSQPVASPLSRSSSSFSTQAPSSASTLPSTPASPVLSSTENLDNNKSCLLEPAASSDMNDI
eukprot:TRINITY_DN24929_c0_g1_i1.p1 TRINITY_DN24929_c0_g1~~TRINITY_DN24929_c0_g1_i1.p1  ORF type:complete len:1428 (+),score=233.23 TRINITY_DN24929_c0_g1_i1:277-4284(+)